MYVTHSVCLSSVTGHLGFLLLLATVHNAAMNMGVKYLRDMLSVLLSVYLEVELLDPMVTQCLIFEEPPDCFPQWLYHVTFPPAMYGGISVTLDSFIPHIKSHLLFTGYLTKKIKFPKSRSS